MCLICGKYFKKPHDLKGHEAQIHKIQIVKDEIIAKTQTQSITIEKLFKDQLSGDLLEKQNIFSIPSNVSGVLIK